MDYKKLLFFILLLILCSSINLVFAVDLTNESINTISIDDGDEIAVVNSFGDCPISVSDS